MKLFKNQIAESASNVVSASFPGTQLSSNEILDLLEYPSDTSMGDIALPCFKLSKVLRKSPVMIAESLGETVKSQAEYTEVFEKVESVNGYLNFYISTKALAESLSEMDNERYGSSEVSP